MNLRFAGDTLLLVEWGETIDPVVNQHVIEVAARIRARADSSIRDIVPGYASLGIHFDPLTTDLSRLQEEIVAADSAVGEQEPLTERAPVDIAVRYGGDAGPDLDEVAAWARCAPTEVVARHAAVTYRVYMLGFVPGFAYLGRVDPAIAAPRRRTPRPRVPAGSVGIAGQQSGVYPRETPGGWQLIGQTDAVMFDPRRQPASLLQPGDRVRFRPVDGPA